MGTITRKVCIMTPILCKAVLEAAGFNAETDDLWTRGHLSVEFDADGWTVRSLKTQRALDTGRSSVRLELVLNRLSA